MMSVEKRIEDILEKEITIKEINYAGKIGSYHAVEVVRLKEVVLILARLLDKFGGGTIQDLNTIDEYSRNDAK